MDKEIVFGPALIEAVNLEKGAIYPRIVLSAAAAVREHYHLTTYYGSAAMAPQQSLLMVDADGAAFVNYLTLLFEGLDDLSDLRFVEKGFETHRDVVSDALALHLAAPRIVDKYRWLADYHNHCVHSAALDEALLIPAALTRPPIADFASYQIASTKPKT